MEWLPDIPNPLSDEEKRFLEKLAQTDPTSPALLRLAQEHFNQNRPDLAVEIAAPVAEAHPYFLGAAVVLSQALAETGQIREAELAMNRPAVDTLVLAEWLRHAADAWERIGNKEKAKRALSASHVLKAEGDIEYPTEETESTGEAVPTITLARLYMEQGYSDRAIAVCHQILNSTPDHQQALELLAQLTGEEEDEAGIPEDLTVEPAEAPTDYSAIRAQKEAQLFAEQADADVSQVDGSTDYSAIEALAEEEELMASEAAEADDIEGIDIPEEKLTTDYSAVEAATEEHDLEDLDVPEEAALTDYTAIHALEEEEGGLPEPEDVVEEDFTLPEPEEEEAEAEDLEGLDIPEEAVTTDYSAVEAVTEEHDLEGLDVPEEAALTDYTAIHALEEEEEGLPEPEKVVEEDFTLPEPEEEEAEAEDLEGLDVPEEAVTTDYSAVEAVAEEHDLEGLDVPEEAALTDYTAIQALEEEDENPPEPEVAADEDFTLPEPEDGELEAEEFSLDTPDEELLSEEELLPEDELLIDDDAIQALETDDESPPEPEVAADEDFALPEPEDGELEAEEFSLDTPEEELLSEDELLPEKELLIDDDAIQSLEEEDQGPPEPEIAAAEDFTLPEPEDGELEAEEFSLDTPDEELITDDEAIQALEAEDDVSVPEDSEWQLDDVVQDEPEVEEDWDSDALQPSQAAGEGATDYDSIEDLGDVLDEEIDGTDQDAARARKRKLAERLEKMRDAAARQRRKLEDN